VPVVGEIMDAVWDGELWPGDDSAGVADCDGEPDCVPLWLGDPDWSPDWLAEADWSPLWLFCGVLDCEALPLLPPSPPLDGGGAF